MNIELLTNRENTEDLKKIIDNIDNIKSNVDIYELLVEEQVLVASA